MAADAASVQNMPEVLDEFGRDMNVEKRRQVRWRTTFLDHDIQRLQVPSSTGKQHEMMCVKVWHR